MIVYMLLLLIVAAVAYGMGSLSSRVIASVYLFNGTLTHMGRGNRWLSNFRRVYGIKGFLKLLLVELVRDLFPLILGGLLLGAKGHADVGRAFAGFCLVLGRLYPVFYNLRGSHASICLIVMGLMLGVPVGAVVAVLVILVTLVTRYLSLGAIAGAIGLVAAAVLVLGTGETTILLLCAFTAGAVVFKHIPAIARIIAHHEERLSFEQDLSYKFDEKF